MKTITTDTMHRKTHLGVFVFFGVAVLAAAPFIANAAPTADSELTQVITAGALSTDILNESGADVTSPSFAMSAATVSNQQQSVTGTFGTNSQRVTVDNPQAANSGWTLTWNATTPGTGEWVDGGNSYPYNDTIANGRLTVNPAAGSLTSLTGTSTSITLGSSTSFSASSPVTLISAAAGSDDIWNGYVTGISLTQTIPASQPAGSYIMDMTQTVAAI